jgi:tetratricopeptide (TPR) repeat protein
MSGPATGLLEDGLIIAEQSEQPYAISLMVLHLGSLFLFLGQPDRAIPFLERSVQLCRTRDLALPFLWALSTSALAYARVGRIEEANGLISEVQSRSNARLSEARSRSDARLVPRLAARYLIPLGEACLLVGRDGDALEAARRALEVSDVPGHRVFEPYVWRLHGDIHAQREPVDADQAESRYRRSLALAEELGMRPLQAHCHLGLGKLYRRTGRHEEARAELSTAVSMLREMGLTYWLPDAEAELDG